MRVFILILFLMVASFPAQAEPLVISNAWIRATPPGVSTAAAYISIENRGSDERLLGLDWDGEAMLEIHTITHQQGMMQMAKLDYLDIPAREVTALTPGEQHIMFVGLNRTFTAGETVCLTLVFQMAGSQQVEFKVIDFRGM